MIFVKLIIFIMLIFLAVMIALYFFTKNKKYLSLAKTVIGYLVYLVFIITAIYFSLRYFHL
jgi:hypothetical protein